MTTAQLPARRCPYDPALTIDDLQDGPPMRKVTLWNGRDIWLVTRHQDAQVVLTDRRFSADSMNPAFPPLSPNRRIPAARISLSRIDDPRHGAIRRMLNHEFFRGPVEAMRPAIKAIVDSQIDELLAGDRPADYVSGFALPVPSLVVCGLLGVPPADRGYFHSRASVLLSSVATRTETATAEEDLFDYVARLLDELAGSEDTLLGRLATANRRQQVMTRNEIADLVVMIITAGYETTASMLALSTLSMLTDPELFRVFATRSAQVEPAIEELLRFHSVVHMGVPRLALDDVQVGGVQLRAGDGVVVLLAAVNHDRQRFDRSEQVDLARADNAHMAFGHGVHKCLGRPLARAELEIALCAVASRIPTLRLAVSPEDVPVRDDSHVFGLRALPVTW